MVAFASLDKRMMRDVNRIHDFLWHDAGMVDGARLLEDLRRESQDLDAFLGAGGKLRRHAWTLIAATREDKERHGGTLYELLYNTYNLTAATEHVRKKDPKGAAEHVAWVVESDSIGTCVALDRFSLVQEWEGGKIDFEAYASQLADLLQGKGVADAGQYKRLLLAARTFGKEWNAKAPPQVQGFAARAAIAAAAWATVATRSVRSTATGRAPGVPLADYSAVIQKIVSRL